jgi:DNA-binding NtrC family response regulator
MARRRSDNPRAARAAQSYRATNPSSRRSAGGRADRDASLRLPTPATSRARHIRLLVVDRDSTTASACQAALESNGFTVQGADGIAAALRAFESASYDLTLVELALPDGTGFDLLDELRRISPTTIPIVTSAYSTVRNAVEAVKHGAFDYLVKPLSEHALVESLTGALEKRAFFGTKLKSPAAEFQEMLGNSRAMLDLRQWIRATATSHASVLLLGERGTGKGLVARILQRRSFRSDGPFVTTSCTGADPAQILEEWFGCVRGGAVVTGAFTKATGGTLYLRDVGDLGLELQDALATVLRTRRYTPAGSTESHKLNIRLISATDRNLAGMVADRRFRQDLFYLLASHSVTCPPLRERREDIPLLVDYFLTRFCRQARHRRIYVTPATMTLLGEHSWPGNVRELECVIEEAALRVPGDVLDVSDLRLLENRPVVSPVPDSARELKQQLKAARARAVVERERLFVVRALERHQGNVSAAARAVGMQRPNFQALMRRHGVRSGDYVAGSVDVATNGEADSDAAMED